MDIRKELEALTDGLRGIRAAATDNNGKNFRRLSKAHAEDEQRRREEAASCRMAQTGH